MSSGFPARVLTTETQMTTYHLIFFILQTVVHKLKMMHQTMNHNTVNR